MAIPLRVKLFIGFVLAGGCLAFTLVWLLAAEEPGPIEWYFAAVLTGLIAAAGRFPLHVTPKFELVLDTAAAVAAIALLPAPLAVAVCSVGTAAGYRWVRSPFLQDAFNVPAAVVEVSLATAAYHLLGNGGGAPGGGQLVALAAAAGTLIGANLLLTEVMVSIHLLRRPFTDFVAQHGLDAFHQVVLASLGIAIAPAAEAAPWVLPLLALPVALAYSSLRQNHISLQMAEHSYVTAEEARQRLSAVVEASPDLVATLAPDGRLLYLNAAGRRYLGMPMGMTIAGLGIREVLPGWEGMVSEALSEGSWTGESRLATVVNELPVSVVVVAHTSQGGDLEFLSLLLHDISERKRMEEELVTLATRDALTGLYNRRSFHEQLAVALDSWSHGALLYIDLDGFKAVNDSRGHQAGDEVLRAVAQAMEGIIHQEGAFPGRLGGDEFAAFVPLCGAAAAERIGQEIEAAVEALATRLGAPGLGASAGVALFPRDGKSAEELLAFGDELMYQVKARRKGARGPRLRLVS